MDNDNTAAREEEEGTGESLVSDTPNPPKTLDGGLAVLKMSQLKEEKESQSACKYEDA